MSNWKFNTKFCFMNLIKFMSCISLERGPYLEVSVNTFSRGQFRGNTGSRTLRRKTKSNPKTFHVWCEVHGHSFVWFLHVMYLLLFLDDFNTFFLSLKDKMIKYLSEIWILCFCMIFILCILSDVNYISWICGFIDLIKLEKFSAIISTNTLVDSVSSMTQFMYVVDHLISSYRSRSLSS